MATAKADKWDHAHRAAFINAIRETLGMAPIPHSHLHKEPYSGVQLYGRSSCRVSTVAEYEVIEPL
jgi:hypothetical protein